MSGSPGGQGPVAHKPGRMPVQPDRIVDGLATAAGRRDLDVMADAFGPLRLVHLRRADVVGQAVSWARAEQSGYWQDGDRSLAQPRFDLDQIADLVRTIWEHNAGWSRWFAEQGVEPHSVTYEDVIGDPRQAVQRILDHLGIELARNRRPAARQRRSQSGCDCSRTNRTATNCSPSPGSSRPGRSPRSSTGPTRSPTRPKACAAWSTDAPAASSSSPCREAGQGGRKPALSAPVVLQPLRGVAVGHRGERPRLQGQLDAIRPQVHSQVSVGGGAAGPCRRGDPHSSVDGGHRHSSAACPAVAPADRLHRLRGGRPGEPLGRTFRRRQAGSLPQTG